MFCHQSNDWTPQQLYLPNPDWEPNSDHIPVEIRARVSHFVQQLSKSFHHRKVASNLSKQQQNCLHQLRNNKDLLVIPSDKNLGPVILDRNEYVRRCLLEHLMTPNYEQLDDDIAINFVNTTQKLIFDFLEKNEKDISESDLKFLHRSLQVPDPFAYFYALAKVHKKPWVTRPIVSVAGSITHGLGRWLDQQLQPIVRQLPTYLKSSFELKKDLELLPGLSSTRMSLFTGDIIAMYPSIDVPDALARISSFLHTSPLATNIPVTPIIAALELLMMRNCFRFGDTYWLQKRGTAMGTPPAPAFATLYYAIFELELLDVFSDQLKYLKRYIDDQIGIWIHHPNPYIDNQLWQSFQHAQQTFCSLNWKFSALEKQVVFLDLTILLQSNRIFTSLYEKPLNLYLFIPPSSAHPPNVRQSLVTGGIKRIMDLTTKQSDRKKSACAFFCRLHDRGYSRALLLRLFRNAFDAYRLASTQPKPEPDSDLNSRVFLHVPFHPRDPPRRHLQQLFRRIILQPPGEPYFANLHNFHGGYVGIDRITVAYHRQHNLRNLLFPRHAEGRCPNATPASTILATLRQQPD